MKIPTISHLILVAGPRGSGKSSFLDNPSEYLSFSPDHKDLTFLNEESITHRVIMDNEDFQEHHLSQLTLHVDLCTPIVKQTSLKTIDELRAFIEANPYPNWQRLSKYRDAAERISVVTLFVDRATNHERWINRSLKIPANRMWGHILLAGILGYDKDDSAIHRGLYNAWSKTVDSMTPSSHHYLDICGSEYSLMNADQITNALTNKLANKIE